MDVQYKVVNIGNSLLPTDLTINGELRTVQEEHTTVEMVPVSDPHSGTIKLCFPSGSKHSFRHNKTIKVSFL